MGSRKTGKARFKRALGALEHEYTILTPENNNLHAAIAAGLIGILVPESLVYEVVEQFMDEPGQGTVVLAKLYEDGPVVFEHIASDWYRPGQETRYTWGELTSIEEPQIIFDPDNMDES